MPLEDRDYIKGSHPPSCTCVECANRRLKRLRKEAHPKAISVCPRCGKKSLFYNGQDRIYECLNLKCKASGHTVSEVRGYDRYMTPEETDRAVSQAAERQAAAYRNTADGAVPSNHEESGTTADAREIHERRASKDVHNWLIALLLIFSLSITGIGISLYIGSFVPFWLMCGLSFIYSIEKWFNYFTRRHKELGKLYRLLLNLSILLSLGLLIWSGVKLFSHQLVQSPVAGSLIFLAEFVFFIWMWVVVAKNSWRWPSMKLTIFSLVALFLVLAFAGVQPMSYYKDNILSYMSGNGRATTTPPTSVAGQHTTPPFPSAVSTPPPSATPIVSDKIDAKTGQYKNYYLGLVANPKVTGGSGCYDSKGEFIVLVNNKNAKNPTYSELVNFLKSDTTDKFPYELSLLVIRSYYGQAEDNIDLVRIKEIIDGAAQPSPPRICADFAERLHNGAEMAGIRCGYVIIDSLNHALDVFETTDKGLVFIDDTGKSNNLQIYTISLPNSITFGQSNSWDKVAYVASGKPYGLIDLECALSFGLDYSGYQKWLAAKKAFDTLDDEYDKLVGGRVIVPQDTYNRLQNMLTQEKALASELGGFWDSLGTVASYFITWDGNWRNRR